MPVTAFEIIDFFISVHWNLSGYREDPLYLLMPEPKQTWISLEFWASAWAFSDSAFR